MTKDNKFKVDFSSLEINFTGAPPVAEEAVEIPRLNLTPAAFENAEATVDSIDYAKDYFFLVSGSFVFGDFIESLIYKKRLMPSAVYLTTLGMGEGNADSIVNLTDYMRCQKVNLIVSHYFASVERNKLMRYMADEFRGRPIDIAVIASHCKIALIFSDAGNVMISGSANLSSSDNVEQFTMIHDPGVIDYTKRRLDEIMERFTVYRGAEGKINWSANVGNRSKQAYQAMMEGD